MLSVDYVPKMKVKIFAETIHPNNGQAFDIGKQV
jgi:hypothetical protein